MRIEHAAYQVANTMSDIRSHAGALIVAIKELAKDDNFQKHPLRDAIVHQTQVLESLINTEVR